MNGLGLHFCHDEASSTLSYLVWDRQTRDAVLIDPLLDHLDLGLPNATRSFDELFACVNKLNLRLHWVLETHVHADHFTAAREAKARAPGALLGMGAGVRDVFANFSARFGWGSEVSPEAMRIDRWFDDGEVFRAGRLEVRVIATPGHTPACVSYLVGNLLFTGDALMPAGFGTGRCDFPGGSADALYTSIHTKLYALPGDTRVYPAHEYHAGGRPHGFGETLGTHWEKNAHLTLSTSREEFVRFREDRDKTLAPPKLFEPSLRWNLGGQK